MEDNVILVDKYDQVLGEMPKLEAHQKGVLHRAFSVFIFNKNGELMLQKRAEEKYHSPGLWTNSCCSHPRLGETTIVAAKRRLGEELGFTTELRSLFSFVYRADFDNGLIEHELDHVLLGKYDDTPLLNTKEVSAWRWVNIDDLKNDIRANPDGYTYWFQLLVNNYLDDITMAL